MSQNIFNSILLKKVVFRQITRRTYIKLDKNTVLGIITTAKDTSGLDICAQIIVLLLDGTEEHNAYM